MSHDFENRSDPPSGTAPDNPMRLVSAAPSVHMLGSHGVPAAYGGFETAAEHVGLHLAAKGWDVTVHCQVEGLDTTSTDHWNDIRRVNIPEHRPGWRGTGSFDRKSVRHLLRERRDADVCLTFGYNTGALNIAHRTVGIPNVINMDGIEWSREKWGPVLKAVLLANERCAGFLGDLLIADHPVIAEYLQRHFGARRVRTITYGAPTVLEAPTGPVEELGLRPGHFGTLICRPVPENSIVEIVAAWSHRRRGIPLVILGDYDRSDDYQRKVLDTASDEIRFVGALYDQTQVSALRRHSRVYLHGHTVGGTNPSLVEALGAGNPVIAHDNRYNTWVAGDAGRYFSDTADLTDLLDRTLGDELSLRAMSGAAYARHAEEFTWPRIGAAYEEVLLEAMRNRTGRSRRPSSASARMRS